MYKIFGVVFWGLNAAKDDALLRESYKIIREFACNCERLFSPFDWIVFGFVLYHQEWMKCKGKKKQVMKVTKKIKTGYKKNKTSIIIVFGNNDFSQ